MPKTTKEPKSKITNKSNSKSSSAKAKSSSTKSKPESKTSSAKTTRAKKTTETKKTAKTAKTTKTTKVAKTASKSTTSKKSPSKKATTKAKKTTTTKAVKNKPINILEYYDLPYRYNQTVVKVLAQTPKTLFVYWDISDEDRKKYIKIYGENFFETTTPVLIIHNVTMNYTFEIEINDFANCWYFNVNDEKCEYLVELGRRPKPNTISIDNNYLYITSSNKIESPNGHILFEKEQKTLYFRNVKTNQNYSKDIASLQFIQYMGRIYKLKEIYKTFYKETELLDIDNPTSSFK